MVGVDGIEMLISLLREIIEEINKNIWLHYSLILYLIVNKNK
jgi:hypothetical protein